MQEFLLILKVIIILCGIVSFFSHQSKKARLKEQRARLFSARRGIDLSEEECSAISELWELDVTSSEVYCIDERLEVHAVSPENDKDEEMGFFALAGYPLLMGDKAIEYIDEERINAEVVLHDDMLIVIALKDYNIVDCVNDTLPEAPNNVLSGDCLQNTEYSEQACLDQPATIAEDNTPIEQEDIPAVFKYERPVTLLEARYLHLSFPFYNILVPALLLLAIGIFLYVTDIGLSLEPGWLSAAILAVVCCATLLLLTIEGPKPATENLVVKRYFGQIKTMRMRDNKIWVVFIAPNGEANEAWIPDEWQNTVNLDCDVQFEIEQSQSAVMSIGLNAISEQDTVKKKPRYIVAAIGLLFGIFFIAFNTHWEWREASLAILNNNSSYQINSTADWPKNGFKAGDNLSITQPRLCLDSRYENNRLVYCKQFEYPLVDDDFKVTPDEAVIKAYIHFISEAPDFAPEMPQEIYDYAARMVKIRNSLGLNYEYGSIGTHRIRSRSEMAMFTVESLQLIANHITPYCSTDNQSGETNRAESPSVDEPRLNQACTEFKQQFAALWEEATSSSCEVSVCWDEALKGMGLDDDSAVINNEDAYFSSLRRLKQEIWQATKASLTLSSPEQPTITIDWSGEKSEELLKIVRLRSKLDRSNQEERIKYLNELLLLQSEAAQKSVKGTILSVSNNEGHLTLTVVEKISVKQALSTVMNFTLIVFFGLLITLLFIVYFRSGRPIVDKQVKSKDAWIS
ncbi:hypothetical protein [Vibrio sagamiensis]|uniref:Intracellular growth attenuator protein IgaA n=1 Tax=Vibrio sagamiensis NBRC 104589 TaxID=1219064 RepID=A0A511QCT1_9VIBR|nr:hypothetical protein [Vibrio sagamiensis]PNQ66695.1 hypothetical protein C1141_08540 [Vibrio agarivorans]GEM75109.1 hypothetical protein VSA01S_12210 [Vibrio sagamiensis NBRC 104589]